MLNLCYHREMHYTLISVGLGSHSQEYISFPHAVPILTLRYLAIITILYPLKPRQPPSSLAEADAHLGLSLPKFLTLGLY